MLMGSMSTTTSVSASWLHPGGIVDSFELECSNGTGSEITTNVEDEFMASCSDVWNPGDNYTMIVTSVSNEQRNPAEIVLTASKPVTLEMISCHTVPARSSIARHIFYNKHSFGVHINHIKITIELCRLSWPPPPPPWIRHCSWTNLMWFFSSCPAHVKPYATSIPFTQCINSFQVREQDSIIQLTQHLSMDSTNLSPEIYD